MKQIVCEMCSSTDLEKKDGVYVCQHCGAKYSVEEAKKLMVEVEGAVKIDNSDNVERYLQNARRAMDKEDWDEVEKYYNLVEQNDPQNIEAIFYSAYGKAKASLTNEDIYRRQAIFKALTNSVSIIDDNYDIEKEAELKDILTRMTDDVIRMCGSSFVYTKTTNGNGVTSDNSNETYTLFVRLAIEMISSLSNIFAKFPEDRKGEVVYIKRYALILEEMLANYSHVSGEAQLGYLKVCKAFAAQIKAYDPSFTPKDYDALIAAKEKQIKNANTCGCIAGIVGIIAIVAFVVWIIVG